MRPALAVLAAASLLVTSPVPAGARGAKRVAWKAVAVDDADCPAGGEAIAPRDDAADAAIGAHLLRSAGDVHAVFGAACDAHVTWRKSSLVYVGVVTKTSIRVKRMSRTGGTLRVVVEEAEFCSGIDQPEVLAVLWLRVPRGARELQLVQTAAPPTKACMMVP